MGRFGRRPGLALGYGIAVAGAVLAMGGVLTSSFVMFLLGMTLFGISNTSNLLARYAAADITPAAQRGRAMGLIVWGSTIGSIVGPNLMAPAVARRRAARAVTGGQRVPHQRGRATAWPRSWSSCCCGPIPLMIARRLEAPIAGGAGGGGALARRDRARSARAHRLRLADGRASS